MRGAIIYSSITGVTKKCVDILLSKLENFAGYDLNNKKNKKLTVNEFDFIILGAPYRFGKLNKKMDKFLIKNGSFLFDKKFAIFGVGAACANSENLLKRYYDNLLEEAVCHAWFGGEIILDGLKGMNKYLSYTIAKQITSSGKSLPSINQKNIELFAEKVKNNDLEVVFDDFINHAESDKKNKLDPSNPYYDE